MKLRTTPSFKVMVAVHWTLLAMGHDLPNALMSGTCNEEIVLNICDFPGLL